MTRLLENIKNKIHTKKMTLLSVITDYITFYTNCYVYKKNFYLKKLPKLMPFLHKTLQDFIYTIK